jgi:hypothetical protein
MKVLQWEELVSYSVTNAAEMRLIIMQALPVTKFGCPYYGTLVVPTVKHARDRVIQSSSKFTHANAVASKSGSK